MPPATMKVSLLVLFRMMRMPSHPRHKQVAHSICAKPHVPRLAKLES